MRSVRKSAAERESLTESIRRIAMDALRSEQDRCRRIRSVRSLPYPPIERLPYRLIEVASAIPMTMVDGRVQYHRVQKPAREDTVTPLSLHHHIPRGPGTARGLENGATTETFDDVGVKAVPKSAADTGTLASIAAEAGEAGVWIRAVLRKNGAR